MDFLASVLIFCIVAFSLNNIGESQSTFNVVDFGAVGDGKTDDSAAFSKAWKAFCEATDEPTLRIPNGKTFLLHPIRFEGPCKSTKVRVEILGNVIAPTSIQEWGDLNSNSHCWLCFNEVRGLIMHGSGTIDGQGSIWWKETRSVRPRAMYFHNCNNFDLSGFTIRNSPKMHMAINHCNGGSISNIHIQSPDESPNTDGIDLSYSTQIHIYNSLIESGDDCIAINGGCYNINVTGIACGPGHGISVGSLGDGGEPDKVEGVYVRNCTLTGTQNGARIKTFEGGSGYARKISFEQIKLNDCKNPIIINQHYHGLHLPRKFVTNSVDVRDVTFTSVFGTSVSEQAITLDCSRTGCLNIVMNQVHITSSDPRKKTRAFCQNAHGTAASTSPEVPCLSGGQTA